MITNIAHVGLTVSNLEKSIDFYKNVLGLEFQGQMVMEGKETETLFGIHPCRAKVAYLNGSKKINTPPVELIEFEATPVENNHIKLNKISVSELCFYVSDMDKTYRELSEKGVEFISEPQYFDLSSQGFGKSKAVYFRDPDGIILELIEPLK